MITDRGHEIREQFVGERIANHALGVPLNANHPVQVAVPLDAFDHAVGSLHRHSQVLAGPVDRLVVAAVDRASIRPIQSRKPALGYKGSCVLDIALNCSWWQVRASMRGRTWAFRPDILN